MIEKINLFPYTRFFRMRGDHQLKHSCGGITTILIIVVITVIFMFKFLEVIKKNTITFSSQSSISLEPPSTLVTTNQSDPNHEPFMFALSSSPFNCSDYTYEIVVENFTATDLRNPQANRVYDPIQMEPCTPQHFSRVPDIDKRSEILNISNWQCLPLNKTY